MNRDSALFLRTDQFTSSVRIGTLLEYLLYVKLAEDLFLSHVVPSCFAEISDGFTRYCVTSLGSPLAIGGLSLFVGALKLLSCSFRVVRTVECF